jgi:hypothetical protein
VNRRDLAFNHARPRRVADGELPAVSVAAAVEGEPG